jgi:hypothetical protein
MVRNGAGARPTGARPTGARPYLLRVASLRVRALALVVDLGVRPQGGIFSATTPPPRSPLTIRRAVQSECAALCTGFDRIIAREEREGPLSL